MLKSMTAYGRSSVVTSQGRLTVEIQSINRKFLDLQIFLPKELSRFDPLIRKWIGEGLFRGQVAVRIDFRSEGKSAVKVTPNEPLIKEYLSAFNEIKEKFAVDGDVLPYLLQQPGVLVVQEAEGADELESALHSGVISALEELSRMKASEGKNLAADLLGRLAVMEAALGQIALKSPEIKVYYRNKLQALLNELLPGGEHEERLLRELCLFAEKIDIEEEITRFASHLEQTKGLIGETRETSGKALEFLVQELQREANTMGSKAADIEVSKLALELKVEIERIREQVQNVE